MNTKEVGFIGLGLLGLPMATNLAERGIALRVYNRTASKADSLVARGAHRAARPADAVPKDGIVISALWDDAALESVIESEGFLEQLGSGIHVSTSTIAPEAARRLAAKHAARGSTYVEAPIFGRPEAAAARQLWVPLAGPKAAKETVRPLIDAMGAQGIFDFGEAVGAAVAVKIAGNFLIFSAARSMIEAVTMTEKEGVDRKAVIEMLTSTLFSAPIYQSYGKRIAERAPAMQSPIPMKDIGLFQEVAKRTGARADIAACLMDLLKQS